jgi:predicted sulfurtransferase
MRKNRRLFQSLLLLLLAVYLLYRVSDRNPREGGDNCVFDERVAVTELIYVNHARCRMKCRNVNQRMVEKVYLEGVINCEKSSHKDNKPRFALEKRDDRGDKIRVIVEDDDGKHIIITVIKLGKSDRCQCS